MITRGVSALTRTRMVFSSNFLRNTLNKIYMAVFEKKYGSVQERKEIVIESETKNSMCNTFCVAALVAGMSHDCFRDRLASLIH